jgi:hypothetical protein
MADGGGAPVSAAPAASWRALAPPALRRAARDTLRRLVDRVPPLARRRDETLLRARMRAALGYEPDFVNPTRFNERLGRKILYDRDPLIPRSLDKVAARDLAAERIGAAHLVPLLGVWDRAADIPWDALPDRFVAKASHGSGMNVLVHDKRGADRAAVLRRLDAWLRESHYAWTGEWGYRDIPPRILVEEMLGPEGGEGVPEDFKFYVFRGRPRLLEVHRGRFGRHICLCYDEAFRPMPFALIGIAPEEAEAAYREHPLPSGMPALAELAARLGAGFDFVRIDLYLVSGRAFFGEFTHYPDNACLRFTPPDYDRVLGELWASS